LQISFSDEQEHRLTQQGFIVFNYFRQEGRVCLFSAPTIQAIQSPERLSSQDRLAASLPYVYLICRIAHYQKVIQRENIGSVKEGPVLQRELQEWISQYVTEMQEPDADLRRQRPLNGGKVKVSPDPANPGFFNIELMIQPHLQIEGVNAELTLLTRMPRGEE
jgi:type VI secretion system protein ImpC